jgi:hypothetical protein
MMGSSERIFWYLFNGFLHVDNFVVELFFPAKMLEMSHLLTHNLRYDTTSPVTIGTGVPSYFLATS